MTWVAVAIGGAAVVGGTVSYLGGKQAADAARDSAQKQQDAANALRQQELGYANTWGNKMTDLAKATPQELNILGQSYDASAKDLAQQQELMDAIHPSLMEASKQALSILRGGQSAMGTGIMAQRNQQRQQLIDSLRSQYGPGAENTSIGQQALQRFDMETNTLQPQMLSTLMGVAGQGGQYGANIGRSIAGLQTVGQGYSALQNRMLGAQGQIGANTLGALSGTSQNIYNSAGAGSVGQALQGQALASLGNNVSNAGVGMGMYAMMNRKPAAPTATPGAPGTPGASPWETGPAPTDLGMLPASNANYGNIG